MSLLSSIFGNASQVDVDKIIKDYEAIFFEGESVECAFILVRDVYIFTTKRLILVDKQGITGRKVEYLSIPYKSITRFSVETAGHFDLDAELKIWISSAAEPTIKKTFNKSANIYQVQKTLAQYVCR
ncbi:MAG: PH domain-containing protein [Kiritimatiellae bacterium]|nr:PH domain-containing protein [Kiritimatiellia bacterium]